MTDDEAKELLADTSKRGQPVEPEVLDEVNGLNVQPNAVENNSGQQKETDVKQP